MVRPHRFSPNPETAVDNHFQKTDNRTPEAHAIAARDEHDAAVAAQWAQIDESATLLPITLHAIELAGGSARCMIAGVHLTRRNRQKVPS